MNPRPSSRTLFLVPTSSQQGISSVALGLVRAFQREGYNVGFAKPIADPEAYPDGLDRSVPTSPVQAARSSPRPTRSRPRSAEEMIRNGDLFTLLEDIVALVEEARGESFDRHRRGSACRRPTHPLTVDLDIAMGRSLSAEIIPVVPGT